MNSEAQPIRAPQGATAWTPAHGWIYESDELAPMRFERGDLVLVVSDDGMVHGVQPADRAPLGAVLRVEADVAEVIQRLEEPAGDTASVRDVNELRARMTAVVHRVGDLEDRAQGVDTDLAIAMTQLRHRVRKLEEPTR